MLLARPICTYRIVKAASAHRRSTRSSPRRPPCPGRAAWHSEHAAMPLPSGASSCRGPCRAAAIHGQPSPAARPRAGSTGADDTVDFDVQRIPGDGSCLFRALAAGAHQASTGSMLSGPGLLRAGFDLRQEVCAAMLQRREEIEPFISGVFEAYVANMALEGIWGGEPELAVAVHCLQRPIIVYKQVGSGLGLFGKSLVKVSEYGADEYPDVAPVCVLFSGAHYDLLIQVVK